MAYATSWHALPEVEVQPNNFRVAVAGREMGLNRIRWVHPMTLPQHTHPEHEQANVILTGRIEMTIGAETMELGPGDIAIVPRGTAHSGRSLAGDAVYGVARQAAAAHRTGLRRDRAPRIQQRDRRGRRRLAGAHRRPAPTDRRDRLGARCA
jgi:hypothetical protein